ncbi:MAG: response regulator transcription factor [Bacteroidota bacterium]
MIKVLLVDDNKAIRQRIKMALSGYSHIQVAGECNDGNEVLGFLKNNEVDVILMDFRMKYMNGIEATKLVTENYPSVKVIGFSLYDEEMIKKKMFKTGAVDYLLKEAEIEEIISAINKQVDS